MRKLKVAFLLIVLAGCPDQNKAKGPETTKPGPKPPDPAELAAAAAQNYWNGVGLGSVAEYRVVSENPMGKTTTTLVKTLRSKNAEGYTLTTESVEGGNKIPGADETLSWIPDPNLPKGAEVGTEKLTVGNETLECRHTRLQDPGGTTDLWAYKSNLTVKLVRKTPNGSQETALVRLDPKP